jgi:CheY-like chemotaxis protein
MSPSHPRILVVDDDTDVLDLAVLVLAESGCEVLPAHGGTEALRIIERDSDIDLLFTDIVMPDMDGFALARRARFVRPSLKILYTSGYLKNLPDGGGAGLYGKLLAKPWRPAQLHAEIREALR